MLLLLDYRTTLPKHIHNKCTLQCLSKHTHTNTVSPILQSFCCVFLLSMSHVSTITDRTPAPARPITSQRPNKGLANHICCIIGTFLTYLWKENPLSALLPPFVPVAWSYRWRRLQVWRILFFGCKAEQLQCFTTGERLLHSPVTALVWSSQKRAGDHVKSLSLRWLQMVISNNP